MIKKKRLSWFGHVIRRGEDSNVSLAYKQEFQIQRPRGRPPKRWSDQIRADLNLPLLTIERKASDRDGWKRIAD